MRVLLCGESWVTHSVHIKGVDSFTTSTYVEGADQLRAALSARRDRGRLPARPHGASKVSRLGRRAGRLRRGNPLSDIGANSLLLVPADVRTLAARAGPARRRREYVRGGGGLLMIGGYLSFAGIEGKARYHGTPVEEALPVLISST